MRIRILAAATALLVAVPAIAQDMPGAVDLGALSRSQVQRGTADGYAERGGYSRSANGLSPKARATCDRAPSIRAQYGASDPKVRQLFALCRGAGYRY